MTNDPHQDTFTDLDDPNWLALFENVEQSWFRLETLQVYSVEYEREEYDRFLAEGRLDRPLGDWQKMITRHVEAGRTLQRVHVVVEPPTDYVRYELEAYRQNGHAGEDIRLISTAPDTWPSELPQGTDFWLFDDQEVWDMHYDLEGRFLRATRSRSDERLDQCRRWRDDALARAINLSDYIKEAA